MECLVKTLTEYWQQKQKRGSLGGQVEARRVGSEHLLPSSTLAQEHRGRWSGVLELKESELRLLWPPGIPSVLPPPPFPASSPLFSSPLPRGLTGSGRL